MTLSTSKDAPTLLCGGARNNARAGGIGQFPQGHQIVRGAPFTSARA